MEQEKRISLDIVILETFKTALSVEIMAGRFEAVNKLLKLAVQPHLYLFFTKQTQKHLEGQIFENGDLRDFIYNTLARLKFSLAVEGYSTLDICENIALTGYDDLIKDSNRQPWYYDYGVAPSETMAGFWDAYKSKKEDRLALLNVNEWGIVVFLTNIYYIMILNIVQEAVEAYEKNQENRNR